MRTKLLTASFLVLALLAATGSAAAANNTTTSNSSTSDWNIINLRNVPVDQSFEYLVADSENVSFENSTVVANGSAMVKTRKIAADYFDRVEIGMETSGGTLKVLNATENATVLKSVNLSVGTNTVNLSGINSSEVRFKLELDDSATVTSFKLYGDLYSGGLFGGGGGITGGFFANVFGGIGAFIDSVFGAIFGVIL